VLLRRSPAPEHLWQRGQSALSAERIDEAEAAAKSLLGFAIPRPWTGCYRPRSTWPGNVLTTPSANLAAFPTIIPAAAQARLMAGQIELRRKRVRIAEQYLRDAVRLDPKLVPAHRELIYIYGYQLRRRELDAEFRALAGLTELTFDNVFHWCLLKNSTWEPGEAAETLATFFVEADPQDRWSRLALAVQRPAHGTYRRRRESHLAAARERHAGSGHPCDAGPGSPSGRPSPATARQWGTT